MFRKLASIPESCFMAGSYARPAKRPDRRRGSQGPCPDPISTWRSSATARPVSRSPRRAGGPAWRSSSSATAGRGRRRTACGTTRSPTSPGHCFGHVSARTVVAGTDTTTSSGPTPSPTTTPCGPTSPMASTSAPAGSAASQHFPWGSRAVDDRGRRLDARLVVDATGRPALTPGIPRRGADGVRHRRRRPAGRFRPDTRDADGPAPAAGGAGAMPTFCYVVPVDEGWLVEETVLAARPPVPVELLRARLEARIGPDGPAVVDGAAAGRAGRDPAGRAAAGSPGARSWRSGPPPASPIRRPASRWPRRCGPRRSVAAAIAAGMTSGDVGRICGRRVAAARCAATRRLHDYGLRCCCGWTATSWRRSSTPSSTCPRTWAPYLRIDASPGEVSRTMTAVLRRLPWAMRRRLVVNPVARPAGR